MGSIVRCGVQHMSNLQTFISNVGRSREPVNSLESGLRLVKTDGFVEMARLPYPEERGSQLFCCAQNFFEESPFLHLLEFCLGVNKGLYG